MIRRWWRAADTAGGGLWLDLALYAVGAGFAGLTAAASTLPAHRAWGAVAAPGYAAAAAATVALMLLSGRIVRRMPSGRGGRVGQTLPAGRVLPAGRAVIAALAWTATALLPLVVQAVQRAGGRTDRAQEEVVVIEDGGHRLLDTGTPYLARDDIAALHPDEWLLGYLPYQPGMALFGIPRTLAGATWWTDARVWFALATAVVLGLAVLVLRPAARARPRAATAPAPTAAVPRGLASATVLRGLQGATVLPICALTLATGGDDLPVLALCLLALALLARDRPCAAGVAIGLAGALKLFALPVTVVLLVLTLVRGRRALARFAAGAVGLPIAAVLPAALLDASALAENVLRFPLGDGLVSSPARSPLPGYLIANHLPGGRLIASGLLLAAGVAIAVWLLGRPPRDAAAAAAVCACGLLVAMLLMPATRFGYLLYPAAIALWIPCLSPDRPPLARPGELSAATGPAG